MLLKKNTFGFRLNLYIASLITLIALIVFSAFYIVSRNTLLSSAKENAKNIAEKNVNKIDGIVGECAKIPYNLSLIIENHGMNKEELVSILKEIVKNNKEIYGSAIAFEPYSYNSQEKLYAPYVYKKNGKLKSINLNNESYQYLYQDWYQIPEYLNKPVWSEPYYDEGGGNILMTTYSVPFYNKVNGRRKFRGVITVDVSLDWLDSLVSSIKIYNHGFAFVVSSTGTIVTHPNEKFIMNETIFSLAEEHHLPNLRKMGRMMIKGKSGFEKIHGITFRGKSRIYFTPLHSNNWSLAVIFPDNELYANLNNLSLIILLIGIIGMAIILLTVAAVSKKLTNPLSSFAEAATEIGSGKFNVALPQIKSNDEIGGLYLSFKKMQVELNNYIENLKRTTADKEKIESELRIAHKIQMDMIPKLFPPFPERDDIDLHAFLDPAREVGGDLYDFFFIDDDKLAIIIGDVAGKGVPASLFMAVTRTLLRSKMIKGTSTAEVIDQINKDLIQDNDSKLFVTLLLCIVDIKTKTIEYTNAGHNPPYIVTKDRKVNPLKDKHGMALGLFDLKPYGSSKYVLNNGDKFVLYTDGINEAMDVDHNLYDYERFEARLNETNNLTAKESTSLILNDIKTFTRDAEQSDDITLLVFSIK